QAIEAVLRPAIFNGHVLAFDVAGLGETLAERVHEESNRSGRLRIEHTHHRHRRLLRAGRERPRRRRTSNERDELAAPHSITSSARASTVAGISMPRALAVLRLRIVSYLVGACTGRSAGFSPLRMRST